LPGIGLRIAPLPRAFSDRPDMTPRWITRGLLEEVAQEAQRSPRKRKNRNFHEMSDSVHRLLNALEPGTYIRPHRHLEREKAETAIAIAGRIGVIFFGDLGERLDRRVIAPASNVSGVEVPPGAWHTFVALESGSVFFEAKAGPYRAPAGEELAPWAPPEGSSEATAFELTLRSLFKTPPGSA
jgi:cupin fold WbuC family metalloprotein